MPPSAPGRQGTARPRRIEPEHLYQFRGLLFLWPVVQVLWVKRAIDAGGDRIGPVVQE